jgi:hypothetical protein
VTKTLPQLFFASPPAPSCREGRGFPRRDAAADADEPADADAAEDDAAWESVVVGAGADADADADADAAGAAVEA